MTSSKAKAFFRGSLMMVRKVVIGILIAVLVESSVRAQQLPQNQMAAAAVMIQIFVGWWRADIKVIDDNSAYLSPDRTYTGLTTPIRVSKIDDCVFVAMLLTHDAQTVGTDVAWVNLAALSDQYWQSTGPNGRVVISGLGREPAMCWKFVPLLTGSEQRCNKDLILPAFNDRFDPVQVARGMRALEFLQRYCPPKKLPF